MISIRLCSKCLIRGCFSKEILLALSFLSGTGETWGSANCRIGFGVQKCSSSIAQMDGEAPGPQQAWDLVWFGSGLPLRSRAVPGTGWGDVQRRWELPDKPTAIPRDTAAFFPPPLRSITSFFLICLSPKNIGSHHNAHHQRCHF